MRNGINFWDGFDPFVVQKLEMVINNWDEFKPQEVLIRRNCCHESSVSRALDNDIGLLRSEGVSVGVNVDLIY